MCQQLQWVFALCNPKFCQKQGKATRAIDVKLCERFPDYPPFRLAFWALGRSCCKASVEQREIPAKCHGCFELEEKAAGRNPRSWEDYIKPIVDDLDLPDFVWPVNISTRMEHFFRELDWNPKPRQVPLESGEVSPTSQSPFPDTSAGVLNAEYDPRDWKPADKDRQIIQLVLPDDPPIAYWPRPIKPPGDYTGPASEVPIKLEFGTLTRDGWAYRFNDFPLPDSMKPLPPQPSTPGHEVSHDPGHVENIERQNTVIRHSNPNPEARHPADHVPKRKTFEGESDDDSPTKKLKNKA